MCVVLYCIVLYCILLYSIVFYCILLYSTVFYCKMSTCDDNFYVSPPAGRLCHIMPKILPIMLFSNAA